MKKTFTPNYIKTNRGCYEPEQVAKLSFIKNEEITIAQILESEIPLKDKFWFVVRKCELSNEQKQHIAIGCAEIVLEIYERKYPNNKAPREAIQAAKDYLAGVIGTDELIRKRSADAAYAAADAYAADAAADAAAAYAAYAADAAAAKAAPATPYTQQLFLFLTAFVNAS